MLPHPEIIEASEVGHVLLVDDGKIKLTIIDKGKDDDSAMIIYYTHSFLIN